MYRNNGGKCTFERDQYCSQKWFVFLKISIADNIVIMTMKSVVKFCIRKNNG